MRIAVRVDGSSAIGTGHVKRCISLAEALRDAGGDVRFVFRDLGQNLDGLIGAAGFALCTLPQPDAPLIHADDAPAHAQWAGVSQEQDAVEFIDALRLWSPDWVIVDHYAFDRRWHELIRDAFDCKLAVIDDLGDRQISADILIDHNPHPDHRAKYASSLATVGRVLGGPRFALLSAAYRNLTPVEVSDTVKSIGMFMGGVDGGNHAPVCLAAIRAAGFDGPVEIVSTSANPHLVALGKAIDGDGNASLALDLPDLAHFFQRHGLQIGAGGGATWERCRTGVPSVVLETAANQAIVVDGLLAAKAAIGLRAESVNDLTAAIQELLNDQAMRHQLSTNATKLVDGKGCERLAVAMLSTTMSVRTATMDDAALMHCWRNAPETRQVSIDNREIQFPEHVTWLQSSLANENRMLLIGMIGEIPVGVVRLDRGQLSTDANAHPEEWEVSIYLDPSLHALGLGNSLLQAGEDALRDRNSSALRILAETLPENATSQAMFRRAGYRGDTHFAKELA